MERGPTAAAGDEPVENDVSGGGEQEECGGLEEEVGGLEEEVGGLEEEGGGGGLEEGNVE
jgi:hypothetical protein